MLHCPRSIVRAIVFSGLVLAAGPALAADPTGDWRVADGVANIRVAQCNGSMWGVVAWEKKPGAQTVRSEAGGRTDRYRRRYLPTPRYRAVCPLAPAGTATRQRAS